MGMRKSALPRYFGTREQILKITAEGWRDWSAQLCSRPRALPSATPEAVGQGFAATPAARPLLCDLLAQAPLNHERHVSIESVRSLRTVTLDEVDRIGAELGRLLGLQGPRPWTSSRRPPR
ncbi:hypothetical protein [Streptomyces tendae]